jgi:hypothetical protein
MDSKKAIYLILLSIILSSCILFTYDGKEPDYYSGWYLKNSTDSTFTFYPRYEKGGVYMREIIIYSGSTVEFEVIASDKKPKFNGMTTYTNDSVAWIRKDNKVRIWRKSEKNNSGKQFFNESFWDKQESSYNEKPCTIWTFEITPEDIVSP